MEKFLKFMNHLNMKNQTIVLGISTGVDSMALLDMFMKVKELYNLNIVVSHINHQKRKQSEDEEKFIINYCKEHNLILEVKYFEKENLIENFQNDARNFRYNFYFELCNKYNTNYFSLAHHGNDQIETVLMRIIRGSSLKGYGGMARCSEYKGKTLLRPLLNYTKEEIYQYAKENKLHFFEDESNKSDDYTRNRIRHNVLPGLFEESSDVHLKFLEFSEVLRKAGNCIDNLRDQFIANSVVFEEDYFSFSIDQFDKLDQYLKEEVLFELLKRYRLSKSQIEEILKIISSNRTNIISNIQNQFTVIKEYNKVICYYQLFKPLSVDLIINELGIYQINDILKINVIKNESIEVTKTDYLCYNTPKVNELYVEKEDFPLRLRNRQDGDRISLRVGKKKVKDILIDEKIGFSKRMNSLVLENKDGEILWIVGIKRSDKLKNHQSCEIKILLEGYNKNA